MIYRKSILEKIKSPENLDSMQEIAKPMNLLLLIGLIIVGIATVVFLIMWV